MPNSEPRIDWIVRASALGIAAMLSGAIFLGFELLGELKAEIGSIASSVQDVEQIGSLRAASASHNVRINALSQNIDSIRAQNAALNRRLDQTAERESTFAQLSSARTQLAEDGPVDVRLELRDAIQGIDFDPRRDDSHVRVAQEGAYFIVAAPQTRAGDGCLDLWMAVDDRDVANSNIRVCHSDNETSVGVSQGVMCLRRGDTVSLRMSGSGIEATQPSEAPLIPSVIFTMLRVGDC